MSLSSVWKKFRQHCMCLSARLETHLSIHAFTYVLVLIFVSMLTLSFLWGFFTQRNQEAAHLQLMQRVLLDISRGAGRTVTFFIAISILSTCKLFISRVKDALPSAIVSIDSTYPLLHVTIAKTATISLIAHAISATVYVATYMGRADWKSGLFGNRTTIALGIALLLQFTLLYVSGFLIHSYQTARRYMALVHSVLAILSILPICLHGVAFGIPFSYKIIVPVSLIAVLDRLLRLSIVRTRTYLLLPEHVQMYPGAAQLKIPLDKSIFFRPGQFFHLRLPSVQPGLIVVHPASAPCQTVLHLIVLEHESAKNITASLRKLMEREMQSLDISLMGPFGTPCSFDKSYSKHILIAPDLPSVIPFLSVLHHFHGHLKNFKKENTPTAPEQGHALSPLFQKLDVAISKEFPSVPKFSSPSQTSVTPFACSLVQLPRSEIGASREEENKESPSTDQNPPLSFLDALSNERATAGESNNGIGSEIAGGVLRLAELEIRIDDYVEALVDNPTKGNAEKTVIAALNTMADDALKRTVPSSTPTKKDTISGNKGNQPVTVYEGDDENEPSDDTVTAVPKKSGRISANGKDLVHAFTVRLLLFQFQKLRRLILPFLQSTKVGFLNVCLTVMRYNFFVGSTPAGALVEAALKKVSASFGAAIALNFSNAVLLEITVVGRAFFKSKANLLDLFVMLPIIVISWTYSLWESRTQSDNTLHHFIIQVAILLPLKGALLLYRMVRTMRGQKSEMSVALRKANREIKARSAMYSWRDVFRMRPSQNVVEQVEILWCMREGEDDSWVRDSVQGVLSDRIHAIPFRQPTQQAADEGLVAKDSTGAPLSTSVNGEVLDWDKGLHDIIYNTKNNRNIAFFIAGDWNLEVKMKARLQQHEYLSQLRGAFVQWQSDSSLTAVVESDELSEDDINTIRSFGGRVLCAFKKESFK